MKIGKYDIESFVKFLRDNPSFISDVFHMISLDGDVDALKKISEYFNNLDLTSPFKPRFPLHKNYVKFKPQIEEIIRDKNEYALSSLLKIRNYLNEKNDIVRHYSQRSKEYDKIVQFYWPYGREETVKRLELKPGEKLLEIGVGTGLNLKYFPDYCEVTGIDVCEGMLAEARKKLEKYGKKNVKLHLMSANKMKFQDNTFDKALSIWALCSMSDPLGALEELCRVCKPQAKIAILEVVRSPIEEVALLQILLRPINRKFDHIYIEGFPVNSVPFDCYMDLLSLLEKTSIKPVHTEYLTYTKWVLFMIGQNAK